MKRIRVWIILVLLFSLTLSVTHAQTSDTRDAVLVDLSEQIGETVTLRSLTSWTWNFGSYAYVVGLRDGCDAAPASPPTTGDWQRYSAVYQGVTYEYVVSDNLESLILCNERALQSQPTASPSVRVTPMATATVIAPVGVRCVMEPRLVIGDQGRVTPGDPNWVHNQPFRAATKIGEIPAGAAFTVLKGPQCDNVSGMNYWEVQYGYLTGWTAEGLEGEYWLEPEGRYLWLTPDRIGDLTELGLGQIIQQQSPEGVKEYAFSHDGRMLATSVTTGTVIVWDTESDAAIAMFLHAGGVNAMAFDPNGLLLATAGNDGKVRVWDVADHVGRELSVFEQGATVTSIAFNADGDLLASGDVDGWVMLTEVTSPTAPVLLQKVQVAPAYLLTVTFSPDNTMLIARTDDGRIKLWGVEAGH